MYIWRKHATTDWQKRHGDNLLRRFGTAVAIVERPGKVRTLLEVSCSTRKQALELQNKFGGAIEKLRADWLESFAKESRLKPIRVGSHQIVIPAEAAFGTGEHATTAMCLHMLERVIRRRRDDWTMLDAGTGSGILAIAASRLGAKQIVAIDIDPLALKIARRNARANRARNIQFHVSDVLKHKLAEKFDVITANLFSEILIAALPIWRRRLTADGCMILSGVLRLQERTVIAALRQNGFVPHETKRRGKWLALLTARRRKMI
ncbi:MAG TPA: 50S ribosomal protein L11 methyltransferase [Chthoniobacterales bacterium]|nr:50S ribosomal protein L11 methyltransferase [Chthoniobacterales bacterium]